MKLDDINDALGTSLDSEDYDSIGGIIMEYLDRLPEEGEEVRLKNGILLTVKNIEQNRIQKVQMVLPEPVEAASETSSVEDMDTLENNK